MIFRNKKQAHRKKTTQQFAAVFFICTKGAKALEMRYLYRQSRDVIIYDMASIIFINCTESGNLRALQY